MEGTIRTGRNRDVLRRWAGPQLLVGSILMLLALGLFLAARRSTGALSAPLAPLPLVATAVALTVWAWCVRCVWQRFLAADASAPSLERRVIAILPTLTIALFAIACSLPHGQAVDWIVWLSALAVDLYGCWYLFQHRPAATERVTIVPAPRTMSEPAAELDAELDADSGDHVLQQLTRLRTAEGRDMLHGTLVADFDPGVRVVSLNVAFCPPFERLPHVEVEIADGPDCQTKIVQHLHNGTRIDVQLTKPARSATAVSLELVAIELEDA